MRGLVFAACMIGCRENLPFFEDILVADIGEVQWKRPFNVFPNGGIQQCPPDSNLGEGYVFVPGETCDSAERFQPGLAEILIDSDKNGAADIKEEHIYLPKFGWIVIEYSPSPEDKENFVQAKARTFYGQIRG